MSWRIAVKSGGAWRSLPATFQTFQEAEALAIECFSCFLTWERFNLFQVGGLAPSHRRIKKYGASHTREVS